MRLDVDSKISPDLELAFFTVKPSDKEAALIYLLRTVIDSTHQSIVFASTKHHVEYLHELLIAAGMDNAYVYGALDQAARKLNLERFREGKVKVMVVTDVAARGIDIPLLNNVIHYDFAVGCARCEADCGEVQILTYSCIPIYRIAASCLSTVLDVLRVLDGWEQATRWSRPRSYHISLICSSFSAVRCFLLAT